MKFYDVIYHIILYMENNNFELIEQNTDALFSVSLSIKIFSDVFYFLQFLTADLR